MLRKIKLALLASLSVSILVACSESDAPQEKQAPVEIAEKGVGIPSETPSVTPAIESPEVVAVAEPAPVPAPVTEEPKSEEIVYIPNGVVYQEAIYKDWPYTEVPSATPATLTETVEEVVEETIAAASDKPYQVIDGKISENALNGWRTYNGGGCGTCHGKGGIGAVGPNLANSVANVLSKEEFIDIVANGRPGTMMRPHKTNKRVMDNMEDLYVYLLARGDDILGPGNLIKQPLGK